MPRRPLSPDTAAAQAAAKGGKPDKGKGGKAAEVPDAPPPPEDPDDRLVYDAYITALTAIDRIVGYLALSVNGFLDNSLLTRKGFTNCNRSTISIAHFFPIWVKI